MSRHILLTFAVAALLSLSAQAQFSSGLRFHGVPASATSPTPDGRFHGVPASAISPTPDPQNSTRFLLGRSNFQQGRFFSNAAPRDRRHHPREFVAVPVYVPEYVPYYTDDNSAEAVEEPPAENMQPQPEPPARTIFERRPAVASPDSSADLATEPSTQAKSNTAPQTNSPAAPTDKPESLPSTVLIFRDGHRQEVRDYAIVGDTLFDLSFPRVTKKIPLAQLDLEATRKENEQNGVDFHLPN